MHSFLQLNLHKAEQVTVLLGQALGGTAATVAFLTEPHTVRDRVTGMPGHTKLIYDKSGKGGQPRAAILATKDLTVTALETHCSRDCAAALIKLNGRNTVLASIYLDIKKKVTPEWLTGLMDDTNQRGWAILFGIDTNAHSCLYGPDGNARGEEVEDFILNHNLTVENHGMTPTFETMRGNCHVQTHIDVTLSRDLPRGVERWRLCREHNASDHNTILFEIESDPIPPKLIRPWSKTNWGALTAHLSQVDYQIPSNMSMKKLEKLVAKMYGHLHTAVDLACPEIEIKPKVPNSNWATEEHDIEQAKVKRLYTTARDFRSSSAWDRYREADKAFKKRCKKDKNNAWNEYKAGLESEKDTATLTRLAQRREAREINALSHADDRTTQPGKDTIDVLSRAHFPAATNQTRVTYNNRRNCSILELQDKYKTWINREVVTKALAGFEKNKSPGPDGIKPLVFEHLPHEFLDTLTIAYKAAIHLGYTVEGHQSDLHCQVRQRRLLASQVLQADLPLQLLAEGTGEASCLEDGAGSGAPPNPPQATRLPVRQEH